MHHPWSPPMLSLTASFYCAHMGAHSSDSMEMALDDKDIKSCIHAIRSVRTHEGATEGAREPQALKLGGCTAYPLPGQPGSRPHAHISRGLDTAFRASCSRRQTAGTVCFIEDWWPRVSWYSERACLRIRRPASPELPPPPSLPGSSRSQRWSPPWLPRPGPPAQSPSPLHAA